MNKNIFLKRSFVILLVACILIIAIPHYADATPGSIEIVGDNCGLVIKTSDEKEDTSNLNPGDIKRTKLTLVNSRDNKIEDISIKTNIITKSESSPRGGNLADILKLTIKNGNRTIIDDLTFRDASNLSSESLGSLAGGAEKVLDFVIDFSSSADNDYQGASFQTNWTFTTTCTINGDGGGKDGGGNDGGGKDDSGGGRKDTDAPEGPDEEISLPDEGIPAGPIDNEEDSSGEPDIEITVDDEEIPAGPAEMPRTGERAPLYYMGFGAFIITIGLYLRRKI